MTKKEIRKIFKQKRSNLTDFEREQLSLKICEQVDQLIGTSAQNISIFLPIERFLEINTWPIIENSTANYYLPVVDGNQLKHVKYESQEQLKISDWGIPEPKYGEEVNPAIFDCVLIPLLAFDSNGNRVGYGAGFYDSFLKDCSKACKFVGLSFFEAVEKIDDIRDEDIKLHSCVTPEQVFNF